MKRMLMAVLSGISMLTACAIGDSGPSHKNNNHINDDAAFNASGDMGLEQDPGMQRSCGNQKMGTCEQLNGESIAMVCDPLGGIREINCTQMGGNCEVDPVLGAGCRRA